LILLILSEKRIAFREVSDIDQTGRFLARGSALVKLRKNQGFGCQVSGVRINRLTSHPPSILIE